MNDNIIISLLLRCVEIGNTINIHIHFFQMENMNVSSEILN